MRGYLLLDIETYAADDATEFIEEPSAPSHYKDEAKIKAYVEKAKADAVGRCALDVDLCRVVCVGVQSYELGTFIMPVTTPTQEYETLAWLWDMAHPYDGFCGFNILSFDLPVLVRRSQYLGLRVPHMAMSVDKYRNPHLDLMDVLTFKGKLKARGLSFYCKRFGITVPDEHKGKDIAALVQAGDWAGIADHNRADLDKTRQLGERLGVLVPKAERVA